MSKKLPFISTLAIAAIFMTAHPVKVTKAQEKTTTTLSPVGEWSAQALGVDTENGYCALSRKYSDGFVLTLGQNVMEEYSLAIDYQNQKLDMDKAYKVTLQPGPGQVRAYEMMPASQQAMVLRLGYDDSFITSLESSGVLKVQIDDKNNHFQISDFNEAQKKLSDCMASLKGSSEVKVASDFSAEKVENPEPMKIKEQPKEEPKVEFKKAEAPKIIEAPVKVAKEAVQEAKAIEIAPKVALAPKVIEIAKVGTKEIEVASNVAQQEVSEQAKKIADAEALKAKIDVEQKVAEEQKVAAAKASAEKAEAEKIQAEKEAAQKLAAVEAQKKAEEENKALELQKKQAELKKAQDLQKAVLEKKRQQEEADKLAKEQQLLKEQEVAALKAKEQAEREKVEEEQKLAKKSEAEKLKAEEAENKRQELAEAEAQSKAEMQRAKAAEEAEKEKAQKLVAAETQKKAEEKAVEIRQEADRVAKEQSEKAEEAKEIEIVKEQEVLPIPVTPMEEEVAVAAVQPNPNAFTERVDVKTQQELKEAQEKLRALEQEDRQLYLEARKAQGAIDSAVVETGNQALKKIREYEKKLEAAQADNLALSREMEEIRTLQENGRLDAVSGDATLEQSTKRYNEAEREIRRLGLLLEQQRTAHRIEKQELEGMLFDPAVAEQSQRKRLAELEAKLAEAEAKAQKSSEPLLQQKIQAEKEAELAKQRVAELEKQKAAEEEKVKASELAKQKQIEVEADLQKQEGLAKLTKQKEAELKMKEEQIRLKEMETKLEEADKKLSAMDDVVEFKVVPSASGAPTIVNLDKRDSETYRTESGKVSTPPSYSSSRPSSVSKQPNNMAVQIEPKVASEPPVTAAPSKSTSISFNVNEIRDVLTRAGVGVNSDISTQGEGRYSWRSGALDGRAQVVPIQRAGSLDQFIQNYISQAKGSCNGDFASLPAANLGSGKGFEIACIGDNQETSSSVIFRQKGSEIVAISHETSANDMDEAMDARDRIAETL